jgi:type IV secretion system protein TrbI
MQSTLDSVDQSALEVSQSPRRAAGLRKDTVYIAAAVIAVVILGGLSIASQRQRGSQQTFSESPMVFGKPDMAQTTPTAKLQSGYAGFDPAKRTASYEQSAERLPPTKAEKGGSNAKVAAEVADDEAERLRAELEQMRLVQQSQQRDRAMAEYEAAMNSPLLFKSAPVVRPGDRAVTSATAGQGGSEAMVVQVGTLPTSLTANAQDAKSRFLTDAASVEPYLRKPLIGVQSDYEVKAGGFIPAALVTEINSDLPGEVIAQVTQNVFDTVSGKHLLIPQGTRVLGKYQSLVSNGQNRALIVWTRLVMPSGDSIVLEGMPGTDQAGAAGAEDQVDYHLDKLAAAATLSTAIAYGGNLARDGGRDRDNLDVVGETIAQESSKIGGRIIDRQLDVQPTIRIRQGHPVNVLVNKDMILKPYVEN